MKALENKIGYSFRDKSLLRLALTHSSYANENGNPANCNERLEFLGDSVLSIIVSEYIFEKYKNGYKVTKLAEEYFLSTQGIYKIIAKQRS